MSSSTAQQWPNERRENLLPYIETSTFLSREEKDRAIDYILIGDASAPVPRELRPLFAALRLGMLAELARLLETPRQRDGKPSVM